MLAVGRARSEPAARPRASPAGPIGPSGPDWVGPVDPIRQNRAESIEPGGLNQPDWVGPVSPIRQNRAESIEPGGLNHAPDRRAAPCSGDLVYVRHGLNSWPDVGEYGFGQLALGAVLGVTGSARSYNQDQNQRSQERCDRRGPEPTHTLPHLLK